MMPRILFVMSSHRRVARGAVGAVAPPPQKKCQKGGGGERERKKEHKVACMQCEAAAFQPYPKKD